MPIEITNPRGTANRARAFTMVELLVVIAIIGILAALLLPALSAAKARARRTTCMDNLHQINLGLRMYCDESSDASPSPGHAKFGTQAWSGYRKLMSTYVAGNGQPSSQDKLFACPADTFHITLTKVGPYMYGVAMEHTSLHDQPLFDYSSYGFNGGTAPRTFKFGPAPGIGGQKLSTVKEPAKTFLVVEAPAFYPYSWHQPSPTPGALRFGNGGALFNDARNVVSFVDGHVAYIKIYWRTNSVSGVYQEAMLYNPPAGYGYKWSGD
jgi:prepilin-type N-terminal cleavage/methylation domain-containing protein